MTDVKNLALKTASDKLIDDELARLKQLNADMRALQYEDMEIVGADSERIGNLPAVIGRIVGAYAQPRSAINEISQL